jgi:histidine triad (HIT) family protein
MEPCIFCKIARKEINARIEYEDDDVVAFRDLNPQAPIHILVIPKQHIENHLDLEEVDPALLLKLVSAVNHIARKMRVDQSGFRVVTNTNPDAGQTVNHLHMHILGGRRMAWPPG